MESKKGSSSDPEATSPARAVSPSSTVFGRRSPFRSVRERARSASDPSSTTGTFDPSVFSEPLSCVSKQTFREDCARHRFIVWAAVKRNSCARMKPDEKLRCPLIHCNQQFKDHEAMLGHLAGCDYLASGEYLCYDHMRIERFDDVKCRHCLGHPSKRRKVLLMAKTFFHSLGHRSKKKSQGLGLPRPDSSVAPPPSYSSISPTPPRDITELSAIHSANPVAVELEARSAGVTAPPPDTFMNDCAVDPQALLIGHSSVDYSYQPAPSGPQGNQAHINHYHSTPTYYSPDDVGTYNMSNRPFLQVNTSGLQGPTQHPHPKQVYPPGDLSHSSSVRSHCTVSSNQTTDTSLTSVSAWSAAEYSAGSGFNTGMTSPVEEFAATDPFAASGSKYDADLMHLTFVPGSLAELPGSIPGIGGTDDMSLDASFFSLSDGTSSAGTPYGGNIMMDQDTGPGQTLNGVSPLQDQSTCCSEAQNIVKLAYDVLHVQHSKLKLQDAPSNQLAGELKSLSIRSVAGAGLGTLRALLDGGGPQSAIEALCFIYLVYALSFVTDSDHTRRLSTHLFVESIGYAKYFPPHDSAAYQEIVSLIWQPADVDSVAMGNIHQRKMPVAAPIDDGYHGNDAHSLLGVALNCLDGLEIALLSDNNTVSSPEEMASALYWKHCLDWDGALVPHSRHLFWGGAQGAIQELRGKFSDLAGLEQMLVRVGSRVGTEGKAGIRSVRKLELELLEAGKTCMGDPRRHYSVYIPTVRTLCDGLYRSDPNSATPRVDYHRDAVSLVENLMPTEFSNPLPAMPGEYWSYDSPIKPFNNPDNPYPQPAFRGQHLRPQGQQPLCSEHFDSRMDLAAPLPLSMSCTAIPAVITTPPGHVAASQPSMASSCTHSPESSSSPSLHPGHSRPSSRGPPQQHQQQQQQQKQQQRKPQPRTHKPQKVQKPQQRRPRAQQRPEGRSPAPAGQIRQLRCNKCSYVPTGHPKDYKSNLNRHKTSKHGPPRTYVCRFPDCPRKNKGRRDNMVSHKKTDHHWLPDEEENPGKIYFIVGTREEEGEANRSEAELNWIVAEGNQSEA